MRDEREAGVRKRERGAGREREVGLGERERERGWREGGTYVITNMNIHNQYHQY